MMAGNGHDGATKKMRDSETTPLLPARTVERPEHSRSLIYRVYFTAILMALSFAVTQVPLIYVFGLMTCDEYYQNHPDPGTPDKCKIGPVESSWMESVAILGGATSLFGGVNLFWTSWCIKRFGVKNALLASCIWPAARLLIQNIGVQTGAGLGIMIVQVSQVITVFGGPVGYVLALNSYITEIIPRKERTATLGRITGLQFFGTGFGYLAGGWLSDLISYIAPFRVTLALFCISSAYVALALPQLPSNLTPAQLKRTESISSFLSPLLIFVPRKWRRQDGQSKMEYGVLLLGTGAFLAVLATGYIAVLLQMFATAILDFSATENGYLIALNHAIRGAFLTFAFPIIIERGRKWLAKRNKNQGRAAELKTDQVSCLATNPISIPAGGPIEGEADQEPEQPVGPQSDEDSFQFDLIYARWSVLADAILTSLAAFASKDWHLYMVSVVLAFATGTGSSARGAILSMTSPAQKDDALSAIGFVELGARLATTGVFGLIFSAFAGAGTPGLTFLANGAVALLSFVVLSLTRFPPHGAQRVESEIDEET